MKLTKSKLKQIILEELKAVLYEQADGVKTPHRCESVKAACRGWYPDDQALYQKCVQNWH